MLEKNGCGTRHLKLCFALSGVLIGILTSFTLFHLGLYEKATAHYESNVARIVLLEKNESVVVEQLKGINEKLSDIKDEIKGYQALSRKKGDVTNEGS